MFFRVSGGIALALLLIHSFGNPGMTNDEDCDITRIGPQVGDVVPEFTLHAQDGRDHTLKSLLGPDGLVLVFYRSADW